MANLASLEGRNVKLFKKRKDVKHVTEKEDLGGEEEFEDQKAQSTKEGEAFECFGDYGCRAACPECPNRFTCKHFTREKLQNIYRKYKSKHKGRGKWTRKDLY